MSEEIVLVTSIAPKNIENQQQAIKSWQKNGFVIVSCNTKDEINMLEKEFPEVKFVEMERDARDIMGKPCPYLYDMLQVLKLYGGNICGIVNSDIHLRNFAEEMYDYLAEQAQNHVLFLRRQEIDKIEDAESLNSRLFFGGIDVFIFQKEVIELLEDDGMIIGQAMWDYWFPIMLSEKGVKIREITNPIIFHVTHPFQYSNDVTVEISSRLCRKYYKNIAIEDPCKFLRDKFLKIISSNEAICYLPEEMRSKRVLVIGSKGNSRMKNTLKNQMFFNITYTEEPEGFNIEGFDYVIRLPYIMILSKTFISTIIWLLEKYSIGTAQILIYLRDENSRLKIENTNNTILRRFNEDLEPVVACKAENYNEYLSKETIPQQCSICLCSVIVDESLDEECLRERGIKGKVVLFPAGIRSKKWLDKYKKVAKEFRVVGFIDNSTEKQNTELEGIRIYSPDRLKDEEFF